MADRPTSEKMAVATDNQMASQSAPRDEVDPRYNQISSPKISTEGFPKKKGTFKITSVKLNDADADSMDDLDESHTEMTEDPSSDMLDISRSTDITPSEESLISNMMVNDVAVPGKEASDVSVLASKEVPEVTEVKAKSGTDMHSRFRVVKIETKEPFHRGRWICHDFLDPAPAAQSVSTERTEAKYYDDANSGGSSSAGSSIHYIHGVDDPSKNPLLAGATGTVPVSTQVPDGQHGQSSTKQEAFKPIHPAPSTASNHPAMSSSTQGSMPPQGYYTDSSQGQGLSQVSGPVSQSQPHQSISTLATTDTQPSTGQLPSGQVQQPADGISGQGQPGNPGIGSHTPLDNISVGSIPQPNVYLPHSHYSSGQTGESIPGSSISLQSVFPPIIQSTAHIASDAGATSIAQNVLNQGQPSDTYQTFVHLGNQQIANSHVSQSGKSEIIPTGGSLATTSEAQPTPSIPDASRSSDQSNKDHSSQVRTSTITGSFPLTEVLDKDLNVIQNNASLLSPFAAAVGDLHYPQEEESSGSSTVAIDNKIEQAMDLVKSHLMFAVREEVEVLKEQINELIERNNQLEYENGILRAAASQETLAKLSQPRQPPSSSSS